MKIKLNIKDRLGIINLMPTTGNIEQLVEVFDIVKKLKLSDLEKIDINFLEQDGKLFWDSQKDIEKELDINIEQLKIIKDRIKELDNSKNISINMLETYLKFINL